MKEVTLSPEMKHHAQELTMQGPDDVTKILNLYAIGWGSKKIAQELGVSRKTVKKYLRQKGWKPASCRRTKKLASLEPWLYARLEKHRGNADVVRQDLIQEHRIDVSLRTVQRMVQAKRQEIQAKAIATVRFETPPGQQLQIDFGSLQIEIGGVKEKVSLFVATLGYSRRTYIKPFLHERQSAWFLGIEGAFHHFGGITERVLMDNASALVQSHNPLTREVVFNSRFKAFSHYWGFRPLACAPYRPRTKGKDERAVGYVKRNAIAGRQFADIEALESHLFIWMSQIADERIHGTTGEKPAERFARDEARTLISLPNKPPFLSLREYYRKVQADACIEIDANWYSVPATLVGKLVQVQVMNGVIKAFCEGKEVAEHAECKGRRQRSINPHHLKGIVGSAVYVARRLEGEGLLPMEERALEESELQRALEEYDLAAGGGW